MQAQLSERPDDTASQQCHGTVGFGEMADRVWEPQESAWQEDGIAMLPAAGRYAIDDPFCQSNKISRGGLWVPVEPKDRHADDRGCW